jgi:ribonucleotide monophosphatase NagD (HAD superfamily)
MCLAVLAHVGVAPADAARRVLVIGDRTDTDGLFAAALGCTFALVRTGITDPLATLDPASAPLVALDLPAITDVADWLTG